MNSGLWGKTSQQHFLFPTPLGGTASLLGPPPNSAFHTTQETLLGLPRKCLLVSM